MDFVATASTPGGPRGRIRAGARALARRFMPTALRRWWQRRRANRWLGDYADWAAATAASDGYAAPHILARVTAAVRQVRAGEATFERDGVAFREPLPAWPVTGDMLALARRQGGKLDVLDYGGSLGGTYFNYRQAWTGIPQLRWRVVEQPAFVAAGRREFADGRLEFFDSAESALAAARPDVLLLASVLPYVPSPHALLEILLAAPCRYVLVERTGLIAGSRDRLAVQQVPASLGGGSYPCWLFSRERLLAHFAGYRLVRDELAFDGGTSGVEFRSLWFAREDGAAS